MRRLDRGGLKEGTSPSANFIEHTSRDDNDRTAQGRIGPLRPAAEYRHCTFAVSEAFAPIVNVHVFLLFPPLEHAPDQITSRPFVALSVIDVPVVNGADPLLPTATLIPAGLDVTRSPVLPVAVTVSVTA